MNLRPQPPLWDWPSGTGLEGHRPGPRRLRQRRVFLPPGWSLGGRFHPLLQPGQGRFHLFYLLDWRNKEKNGEGTPWYQISTTDFINFTEHGEMLARGTKAEQDLYVFTGSVVEGEGRCHIFYTGHNPYFRQQGKPEQGVMHAVSDDLLHWTKTPADTFYAPGEKYEPHDWRDPFVFWNPEAREYWALLAARASRPDRRAAGAARRCAPRAT